MEKITEKMKKISTALAASMIDHDTDEWPPVCALFAYQPVHPNARKQDVCDSTENVTEV